jgi:hypothetical protein
MFDCAYFGYLFLATQFYAFMSLITPNVFFTFSKFFCTQIENSVVY